MYLGSMRVQELKHSNTVTAINCTRGLIYHMLKPTGVFSSAGMNFGSGSTQKSCKLCSSSLSERSSPLCQLKENSLLAEFISSSEILNTYTNSANVEGSMLDRHKMHVSIFRSTNSVHCVCAVICLTQSFCSVELVFLV